MAAAKSDTGWKVDARLGSHTAVDFSVILVLPFAVVVALATCIGAAVASRSRPLLIWPFAVSVILSAPVFVGVPQADTFGFWSMAMLGLAVWAAVGTVMGSLVARLTIYVARHLRSI